jgi:hypothetical protein
MHFHEAGFQLPLHTMKCTEKLPNGATIRWFIASTGTEVQQDLAALGKCACRIRPYSHSTRRSQIRLIHVVFAPFHSWRSHYTGNGRVAYNNPGFNPSVRVSFFDAAEIAL